MGYLFILILDVLKVTVGLLSSNRTEHSLPASFAVELKMFLMALASALNHGQRDEAIYRIFSNLIRTLFTVSEG
jgi:hypothetical protein